MRNHIGWLRLLPAVLATLVLVLAVVRAGSTKGLVQEAVQEDVVASPRENPAQAYGAPVLSFSAEDAGPAASASSLSPRPEDVAHQGPAEAAQALLADLRRAVIKGDPHLVDAVVNLHLALQDPALSFATMDILLDTVHCATARDEMRAYSMALIAMSGSPLGTQHANGFFAAVDPASSLAVPALQARFISAVPSWSEFDVCYFWRTILANTDGPLSQFFWGFISDSYDRWLAHSAVSDMDIYANYASPAPRFIITDQMHALIPDMARYLQDRGLNMELRELLIAQSINSPGLLPILDQIASSPDEPSRLRRAASRAIRIAQR